MTTVTAAVPPEAELARHQGELRTYLRTVDDGPVSAPPAPRRHLSAATAEDRTVALGSLAAGAAAAWVICFRLLPWGNPLAYAVTGFVLFLAILTVATSITASGPAVTDRLVGAVITGGAAVVGFALVSTVAYTFIRAAPALPHINMYVQDMAAVGPRDALSVGGVAHALLGSVMQIAIAVVVTVPLALGTAVFMTEVGGSFARVVRTVVEAMTALPSVVAGLFVYSVLIVTLGFPRSGIAAAMALSVMMLPIIARAADVVLRVVPSGLREASLALGASRWRTVWHVVLPTARPGLATALILGIARGVGETSPVLLTSGAAPFFVLSPFTGVMNSLPLFIYSTVRSGEPLYVERGFAAAAILLTGVLVLFVAARLLARQRSGR